MKRNTGAGFMAHKKCELDLMARYRDYETTMRNRQSKQMAELGQRGQRQESTRRPQRVRTLCDEIGTHSE